VVLSFLVFLNAFERLSLGKASALAVLLALLIIVLGSVSFWSMQARQQKA
jgi:ABC-type sugar transport system permease subunit